MNLADVLVYGFLGTVALTVIVEGSRAAGLSRMSMPYLLGTMATGDRGRAPVLGTALHLLNGFAFALLYALTFESLGRAGWWLGALMGVAHAAFVLSMIQIMPGAHPRMATEQEGPTAARKLQPPGLFALNYGRRTPLIAIAAHVVYGLIMGSFYTLV